MLCGWVKPDNESPAPLDSPPSDGRDIRYAPGWVAETDADRIKTALARVVLACALKHHTRRGERDPERWQLASQLVTHGLLRDAGFVLPPDAEDWDGLSVEQAYDRLPEPSDNTSSPKGAPRSNAAGGDDGGDLSDGAPGKQDDPGTGDEDPASPRPGRLPPATTHTAPARSWTPPRAWTPPPTGPARHRRTPPPRPGTRPCTRR